MVPVIYQRRAGLGSTCLPHSPSLFLSCSSPPKHLIHRISSLFSRLNPRASFPLPLQFLLSLSLFGRIETRSPSTRSTFDAARTSSSAASRHANLCSGKQLSSLSSDRPSYPEPFIIILSCQHCPVLELSFVPLLWISPFASIVFRRDFSTGLRLGSRLA